MIPQIFITDYLSQAALQPAEMLTALLEACPRLRLANWQLLPSPPVQQLFSALRLPPQSSQRLALATLLHARLPASTNTQRPQTTPFALLPVHLAMRRDTYSLNSVLNLSIPVFNQLSQQLHTHFVDDFDLQPDPSQRFWWVWPKRPLEAMSPWPQDHLFQQAIHWQPSGPQGAVIRQWSNEMQMLLHNLASQPSEPPWPADLNGLWFASTQTAPMWGDVQQSPLLSGSGEVYAGLLASGYPHSLPQEFATWLGQRRQTPSLWVADSCSDLPWQTLAEAIQARPWARLDLVLPFAECSVRVSVKPSQRWQFWRRPRTAEDCLQTLETALAQRQTGPAALTTHR